MEPNDFAKSGTEHGHQVALFAAVQTYESLVPELKWIYAVPNGGSRGSDARSAMIAGATMKAEGAKKGVSDICLPVARWGLHGLYIEMKKPGAKGGPRGTGESKEQIEFGQFLIANGYWYECCDHWAKAFRLLMNYLQFEHDREWQLPNL